MEKGNSKGPPTGSFVERLRAVTDALPALVAYLDPSGRFVFHNASYRRWFGARTVDGRTLKEVVGAKAYGIIRPRLEEALTGRPVRFETWMPYKSGGPRYVEASYIPHLGKGDRVEGVILFVTDETDRKSADQSEAFLAEVAALLSSTLDTDRTLAGLAKLLVPRLAAGCSIHLQDDSGVVRLLAAAPDGAAKPIVRALKLAAGVPWGVPRVLRTGEPWRIADLTDDDFLRAVRARKSVGFLRSLKPHSAIFAPITARHRVLGVLTLLRPQKRYLPADERLAVEIGRRAGIAIDHAKLFAAAERESIERRRVESALRESRERMALVFEGALDALISMDDRGVIVDWNAQAERIFGWSRGEAAGRPLEDLIIPPAFRDLHRRGLERFRATGEAAIFGKRLEFPALRRDGTEFPVELTVVPHHSKGQVFFSAFLRDLSEKKQAEQALQRLTATLESKVDERTRELREAVRELETFSYTVAHDLRAPLRTLVGFAQILAEEYASRLDETAKDYARRILTAGKRMDALIQDLLGYSRLGRHEATVERIELGDLVRDVLSQMGPELSGLGAEVRVEEPLPAALGHRGAAFQAVANLLSNAAKFVEPGTVPRLRLWGESEAKAARLFVEDNGIGIAPEHHERIFGVFQRLHGAESYPGTGIGLAIVKKAMERMGGRVGVRSELGKGSRFWLEFPAPPPA